MAIFNGTVYLVSIAGTALPDQTEGSISISTEMIDVSTKDSLGYREILPGLKSASISVSGLVDDTSSAVTTLMTYYANRTTFAVKFGVDVGTHDDIFTCATALVTNIETSAGMEDNVTYSATIELSDTIVFDSAD